MLPKVMLAGWSHIGWPKQIVEEARRSEIQGENRSVSVWWCSLAVLGVGVVVQPYRLGHCRGGTTMLMKSLAWVVVREGRRHGGARGAAMGLVGCCLGGRLG